MDAHSAFGVNLSKSVGMEYATEVDGHRFASHVASHVPVQDVCTVLRALHSNSLDGLAAYMRHTA